MFKPKPIVQTQTVDVTITLPSTHHDRLVAAGLKHNLPPAEVLRQFVEWALETGQLAPKRRKSPKKAE